VGDAEDILSLQDVDPALNAKMHIVNNVRKSYSPSKHPMMILIHIERRSIPSDGPITTGSSSYSTDLGQS
jgi:hypothetical protein